MPNLPTRAFGRTGTMVTRLGYGAMELRGPRAWSGRAVTDKQAKTILDAVLDSGISVVVTANVGRSPSHIGRHISDRRDRYLLAVGPDWSAAPAGDHDEMSRVWTRDHLLWSTDEVLRRMRTDHVDLLELSMPTVEHVEEGHLVEVLQTIRAAGKTRLVGISTTSPDLGTYIGWRVFDSFQIPYSALVRRHERLIQKAHDAGAATIVYGGVARGEPGKGQGSIDRWGTWERAKLRELVELGESPTQFLLRFALSHPGIDTVIVGTLNPRHLAEDVRAAEKGSLPDDVYAEAKRRLEELGERPEEG